MTDSERSLEAALGAAALRPDSPQDRARAGALLAAAGRTVEALPHLARSVALDPGQPDVLSNLGAVLRGLGRFDEALTCFTKALELAPDHADARYNLAGTLVKLERYPEAMPHYERLLDLKPGSAEIHTALGKLQSKAGRLDEAISTFERALDLDPSSAETHANIGNALTEIGRIDAAAAAFERAIALEPTRGDFYRSLAQTSAPAVTAEHVAALVAMARDEGTLTDDNRIEVNFALATIYADAGDRPRSFPHLTSANTHKRRFIAYDEPETLATFSRIAATFDGAFLESCRGCSSDTALPVFIFGMPRSGTTLIEQVLASHSAVYGAGEVSFFEDSTNTVLATAGPIRPDAMRAASCDQLREIARRYIKALRECAPEGAARITDKMPANFRYPGLIHTVLPNARMIHARRDPVETCLSNFSQNFAGDQPWAYDLSELGRYYRGYAGLMEHWRTVLPPGAMLEVQYEEVVADFEAQARRIVEFCGLEWDPACLEFYKAKRPVRTASAIQVRQPIYRTSLNRAAEYGDLLKPLLAALEGRRQP